MPLIQQHWRGREKVNIQSPSGQYGHVNTEFVDEDQPGQRVRRSIINQTSGYTSGYTIWLNGEMIEEHWFDESTGHKQYTQRGYQKENQIPENEVRVI